ncbi:MAG: phosphoribosylaminoimidazolesuccinocarboxamide synthase [Candidatus Dormibacteraeota bacterium]|uniref:Phosphoribosylaminoimidazole-succinocarboxamide synthase n=1 Tax=Candidatus Amunia macphersoniae TaxID=3127014 RepID=A0A934KNX2_9BACT|nr:phosphoribosylaminoimidazolesuccinocarboxamide synthase [Candidatus Dormibacteraeota bacterium]
MPVMTTAEAEGLKVFRRGKVRDTFELDHRTLLMVATDRLSAFDVVLPTPIPDKGRVLTQMSRWWFDKTQRIVANHLLPDDPDAVPAQNRDDWLQRSMHVRRAERIDIECVVRGYISGSGWKEYKKEGTLASEALPAGLLESGKLDHPRFTPAAKNDSGHDENISRANLADVVGRDLADQLERVSLGLYNFAAEHCEQRGVILADTKFEFGHVDGELTLIDEIFTPDSSRFWEVSEWHEGQAVTSMDKQFVRDFLETLSWDKTPPGPELPHDVVEGTQRRYLQAAQRICDLELG